MRYTMFALALSLLVPDVSEACHRRGGCWGGRGGCHGGWGGRCSGGWGGGCHGGYYGGGGCYGGGYYGGGGCSGGYAYAGPYSGGAGYANVYYSSPSYAYGDSYIGGAGTRSSGYYDPSMPLPDSASNASNLGRVARVEVIVNDPNADLIIQGQRMSSQGRSRYFVSPELDSGKTYTYTIALKPSGSGNEETRKVDVRAGQNVVVDFTRPDNMNRQDGGIRTESGNQSDRSIQPSDRSNQPGDRDSNRIPPANPGSNPGSPPPVPNPNPGGNPIPR